MSFFGLTLAGKSLSAFQNAANVTADNIGNVHTPGASRQLAILSEAAPIVGSPGYSTHGSPGSLGDGTVLAQIQRVHDNSYDALFRGASSSQYFYSVQQDQLKAAQSSLSEPTQGINAAYTAFQQSIGTLQANPDKPDERANVVSQAQRLVTAISNAGQSLQSQLSTVREQATSQVTQANSVIDQIAALNGQIRASRAVGDNPNTYSDQRDHLIDQLARLLSTQTSIQANGSTLVTVNGQALVNDQIAYHLAPPIVGTNANGTPSLKIGFLNDPNPLNPQPIPLGQGQLAGYVDLYNNKLMPYSNQLDNFTNALAFEANRITSSSYDQSGIQGVPLLQPIVSSKAISAGNVKVGISQPSQVAAATVSTAAGSIVNALNAGNLSVDTAALLVQTPPNAALANPPAAAFTGALQIAVDGITRVFDYNTAAAGNAGSIDAFIANFNAAQAGVTATFDSAGQRVVFSRDPNNESLAQRATPGYTPSPSFAITEVADPANGIPAARLPQTSLNGSLLGILGAAGLQNVPNGSITASIAAGATSITVSNPTGFAVGQTLRIDDPNAAVAENVTITGISGNRLTTTATANAHASGAQAFVNSNPPTGVVQDNTNAFGTKDNGGAVALGKLFNRNVGVPGLGTFTQTGFTAAPGTTSVTLSERVVSGLAQFGTINVGQALTFVNQTGQQANGVVTAVNRVTGTLSIDVINATGAAIVFPATPAGAPPLAAYTAVNATQQQTLGQYYASFVTNVALDTQTAITGTSTQTALSTNIDKVRQGIDGINLDEESQNLVKFQTAYQAAAKTIGIMDSLLQTVITQLGAR